MKNWDGAKLPERQAKKSPQQPFRDNLEFKEADIKGRIAAYTHHHVGDGDPSRVYAHLTASIMSGRSLEFRKQLSADLLAVLRRAFAANYNERPCDLTVDIREMVRETYAKDANPRSRT